MRSTIHRLEQALASEPALRFAESELFELLSAACKACCTEYTGGNQSCPPEIKG